MTTSGTNAHKNTPTDASRNADANAGTGATDGSATSTDADGNTSAGADTSAGNKGINRRILALALPTLGQLVAEPAFILIDTAIIGHVSDEALAGLSIGSTLILTTVGLCVFLAYSTTSRVAQLMGAGQRREGMQAGVDGMWLALLIGAVVSAAIFAGAEPLCRFLGADGAVLAQAVAYVRALVFGVPGMLVVYAANGIYRGVFKVRMTLVAAVAGAALNTVLDMLFVFGFGWGIVGSGVATFCAQWAMCLFLAVPAAMWARADGASLRPRLAGIVGSGADGLPLFVRTLALRAGMVATVMATASMGATVLASYQAVNSAWNFALNILDAIGIASQSLVGNAMGARDRAAVRRYTRAGARAGALMGVAVGVGFVAVGCLAAPLFSPNPDIQLLIRVGMVAQAVFFPLEGWMWALDGILIGAGDYRYLAATCTCASLIYIGVLAVFAQVVSPALDGLGAGAAGAGVVPGDGWVPGGGTATGIPDIVRVALLWGLFNVVFMGGRGVANGLRAHGERWMRLAG